MYMILQWTPFPGIFQPISQWQLEQGEFDLKMNKTHYHEQAVLIDGVLCYPRPSATKLVSYWAAKYPFADYQLKKVQ